MTKSSKLLLMTLCLLGAFSPLLLAQQVTTEMIGPLSGNLTIIHPTGPICRASGQQGTITFTGNVHVPDSVDSTQNTVDYHINLLSVKGKGTVVMNYIGSVATDLLGEGYPGANIAVPMAFNANLFPTGPCRTGFASTRALPVVVTISFGTDFTLSTVSATVGQT